MSLLSYRPFPRGYELFEISSYSLVPCQPVSENVFRSFACLSLMSQKMNEANIQPS